VGTVGFALAPRINAAGRLGDAADAVRLLLTEDEREAGQLAGLLNRLNQERQRLEEGIIAEAAQAAEATPSGPIVLASRGWHLGVVGIVAARLWSDSIGRPCSSPWTSAVSAGDRPGVSPG